jgi:hypothetical protein
MRLGRTRVMNEDLNCNFGEIGLRHRQEGETMRSKINSIVLILGLALVFLPLQSQEPAPVSIEKVAGDGREHRHL